MTPEQVRHTTRLADALETLQDDRGFDGEVETLRELAQGYVVGHDRHQGMVVRVLELREALIAVTDGWLPPVPPPEPELDHHQREIVDEVLSRSRQYCMALSRNVPPRSPDMIPREVVPARSSALASRVGVQETEYMLFAYQYGCTVEFARGVDHGFRGYAHAQSEHPAAYARGRRAGETLWSRRAEGYSP